ncbi:MAG: YggS family pyridoxal phosphate-dependent enzyme [Phycisphaerae bacterium]|nr:YggS family pyridoxal phosphate-dependent enzyme [Phycisphaerae bacterium]
MKRKLAENFRKVQGRIEEACARAGRDPSEITLVAVTKAVGIDVVRHLVDSGVRDLGESRVQELTKRAAMVSEFLSRRRREAESGNLQHPNWHMIGHLQRNKVKALLPWVRLIHSVDSLRLVEEIDAQARKLNRSVEVLMEINAGIEDQKYGIPVAAAAHLAEQMESLPGLRLTGLMAMAPLDVNADRIHGCFARIAELFEEMRREVVRRDDFCVLSMGMSNDFETAIECGSTMVRIGTALMEGVE